MLASHGRYPCAPCKSRPDFLWPDGKRLAVYVAAAGGRILPREVRDGRSVRLTRRDDGNAPARRVTRRRLRLVCLA